MSYGATAALQEAVYEMLTQDAALQSLVGDRIFDAAPVGQVPELYVAIGPEDVRDRSDMTGHAARHAFTVSVVADTGGFAQAKAVAAAVSDVLVDARPELARGCVVRMDFVRAVARRVGRAACRRIDMRFAALISEL